jgi:hypothetical protein
MSMVRRGHGFSYFISVFTLRIQLNPWVSLRRDQLIPVNTALNEQEQLEKGGGGKKGIYFQIAFLQVPDVGVTPLPRLSV